MRQISEATLAILKSQNLTGQNRFSHSLKLEGTDVYTDIKEVKTNDVNSQADAADMVIRADGKILLAYNIGLKLYLKVIDSENDFLSIPNIANDGVLFLTARASQVERFYSLMRLNNSRLLLFVNDIGGFDDGTPASFKCYESVNGLGDDFILKSTLYTFARKGENNYYMQNLTAKGTQGDDGAIFIAACTYGAYLSAILMDLAYFKIFKSTDGGQTWTRIYYHDGGTYFFAYNHNLRNVVIFGNTIICTISRVDSYFQVHAYISTDYGITWSFASDNFPNLPMSDVANNYKHLIDFYSGKDGIFYMLINDVNSSATCSLYKMKKVSNVDYYSIGNIANWELLQSGIHMFYYYASTFYISPRGIIHHLVSTHIPSIRDMGMYRDEYSSSLGASSISISKGKGGSNTATIQASNKDGVLNPKNPDNPLYGILETNKQIIIKQGYGDDLIETFTGMIDDFDMSTWPQTTGIALRDNLKKALDQTVTNGTQHTVDFASQPIENIVGYLCYLANIETGTIEETGISVAMNFSWCSYADAFQQLGDLASFEWGCDSYGKFYFRRDYQPDNMFVAYTFEEGIDLSTLKYKISDKDLYSKVVVFGKSGDTVISYEAPFLDAALYNILPQKILKIDATEASTVEALRKIAERALSMMQSRTAVINFTSIGIPWLEVGDFIGIYERSTGAASIYRLSDLNFSMDKDSFTMSGTAYYYGDSIVPGELPTDTATQTVAPTVNLIPEMTSNIAPTGVARASSIYTSNYEPWQAFNGHSDDYYWNSITNTGWIEYQFPSKIIVDKYMLKARQLTIYNDAMPRDFTFEGFDGEKWVVLDRQTGQTNWGVYQSRTYLFANTVAYSKYRLNVSRNDGYMRLQLEQLAMYYGGGA